VQHLGLKDAAVYSAGFDLAFARNKPLVMLRMINNLQALNVNN
jgi:hypothetical protein